MSFKMDEYLSASTARNYDIAYIAHSQSRKLTKENEIKGPDGQKP